MDHHQLLEIAGVSVGTGGNTVLATDTHFVIVLYGAINLIDKHRSCGTDCHTGWVSTVITSGGKMEVTWIGVSSSLISVDVTEKNTESKTIFIFAGDLTGFTTDTTFLGIIKTLLSHVLSSCLPVILLISLSNNSFVMSVRIRQRRTSGKHLRSKRGMSSI
jgi:hypothetical protein